MNKNFVKVLATLIIFALIIPFAVSCGKEQTTSKPAARPTTTTNPVSTDDSSARIYPDIPNITFDDNGTPYNYRILSFDNTNAWAVRDMYAAELNEDPINDSVFNRNKAIEEKFKIKITEVKTNSAYDLARRSVASNLDEYDLLVIPSEQQANLAQNGYLYRLDELNYLDPTKPWWDNNSYESLSIANAHFLIVGDIQIMDKDATWVQFFNKKMIEDYGLENPFDLVRNNEWTIDKQLEMIKKITDDTNGDGLYTKEDTFGMASNTFSPFGFFYGFDGTIVTKNADDIPELSMNTPKMSQMINYIDEICSVNSKIAFNAEPVHVQEVFEQGRSLFMGEVLQLAERLREMDTDFGLIPYPKFDKDQENYYSVVHPTTCVLSVPLTITDPDRNSIIMEALCAESKYTLRKAYYETSLTTKFLRYDDGSSEMLDIIFANRVYDLGIINNWGSYHTEFAGLFTSGSTDFASMYAKNETIALKQIEAAVEAYMESNN